MLKNILTKIKSQKADTIKSESLINDQQAPQQRLKEDSHIALTQDQVRSLSQKLVLSIRSTDSTVSQSQISRIRYCRNPEIPNILNKVLGCPISHFNYLPHGKRNVKEIDLTKQKFPGYIDFMKGILKQEVPSFNHILVNDYSNGVGIMPHFDGPAYHPKVVVLSLGGPTIIRFHSKYSAASDQQQRERTQNQQNEKEESQRQNTHASILLEDRSIHIFEEAAYHKFLHGIATQTVDTILLKVCKVQTQDSTQLKGRDSVVFFESSEGSQMERYEVSTCQPFEISNFGLCNSVHELIHQNLKKLTQPFQQPQSCSNNSQNYPQATIFEFGKQGSALKGCFVRVRTQNQEKKQFKQNEKKSEKQAPSQYQILWKLEIERQRRVSITIRHKYTDNQVWERSL